MVNAIPSTDSTGSRKLKGMKHFTESELFAQLAAQSVLPILRFDAAVDGYRFCEHLLAHGFPILEITLTSHRALDLIQRLTRAGHCTGVGTLHTVEQAQSALDHGAAFLVSPGLNLDIAALAKAVNVPYFPGVFTPTEVLSAYNAGLRSLKLFPASAVGPAYLKHFAGPFPGLKWLPTGGIAFDDVAGYLEAGALVVGQGTRLVSAEHLKASNWDAIDAELVQLQQTLARFREQLNCASKH